MEPRQRLCVVAVGVPAGAVNALRAVLAPLPARSPAAVVVVHDLPPARRPILAWLLAQSVSLIVEDAVAGERIRAGRVYVAPAELSLTVAEGGVTLDREPGADRRRSPIDLLFESVARACTAGSIGVLLAGGGRDGAAGLEAIRRAGGVTIVEAARDAPRPHRHHRLLPPAAIGPALRAMLDERPHSAAGAS